MDSKDGPKYTTVGSLVNPNAAPLQAPTRRGRAVKWPMTSEIGNSSSQSSSFPFGLDVRSTPVDNPSLHYSPLQQNTDRAVSPTTEYSTRSLPITARPSLLSARVASSSKHGKDSMLSFDDSGDDIFVDDDSLKHMSVKTLTNLASYENPKQKSAQNILSRARDTSKALQFADQASSSSNILQSDGVAEADSRPSSTYSSILSKGPGAPRPLTAGPPGLRQHKPATIEVPATARRSAPLADVSVSGQGLLKAPARITTGQSTSQRSSSQKSYPLVPVKQKHNETLPSSKVFDSIPAEEARKYYQNGLLPANFNYSPQPLTVFGYSSSSKRYLYRFAGENRDKILSRDEAVDALWNEGAAMFYKSIDQAIVEQNRKSFQAEMGLQGLQNDLPRKIVGPGLSVEEANCMSAQELAAPLLSMAFQTLIGESFAKEGNAPRFHYFA
ncbi:hypothetical protein KJ359_008398 [Pestalotiopsis sp. 9143b]|nr:hypothetical protein KJ359_008398 [Pestalotiopsis sp. 9143b]